MRIFYELSWLWKSLGIAALICAAAVVITLLICKAFGKHPKKSIWCVIIIISLAVSYLVINKLAQTPMPISML